MPSTYAHNAIGGETEETKKVRGTEKEKVKETIAEEVKGIDRKDSRWERQQIEEKR